MRTALISAAALLALAGGTVVIAQAPAGPPGSKDVTKVTAGTYAVEGSHTQIVFAYDHMGFTNNMGVIAMPTGSLVLDPKTPSAAKVSIDVPVANLKTGIPALDEHLMKPEFFDSDKFPSAKFESTAVKVDGTSAEITGNLTIKGVTKPVTLEAEFYGAGANPMNKKENIGFIATGTVKRSDFGMGMAVPMVGDDVELKIIAAFQK
jgi:polyisoprenoid-binding protein YceI